MKNIIIDLSRAACRVIPGLFRWWNMAMFARRSCFVALFLLSAGDAVSIMFNQDTGDAKSRELAMLSPFSSRANVGGCSAVLVAPDLIFSAFHCVGYQSGARATAYWNGQHRDGTAFVVGPDVMVLLLDEPFSGTTGKMTAPYFGDAELNQLAWKVGSGGHGLIPSEEGPTYDGIFRAMTQRIEVNNVNNPPLPVTEDWIHYDFDGPPSAPWRETTLYEGGTAPGDSGGPLYLYANGRWYVAGVTSGPDAGFYRDGRVSTTMEAVKSLTGYRWAMPVEPTLRAHWLAESLAGYTAQHGAVQEWASVSGNAAWGGGGVSVFPQLIHGATPTGGPAVRFSGDSRLILSVADNPFADQTAMTIAMVFRLSEYGIGEAGQWFENTGIIDASEGGAANDWGLGLSASGRIGMGMGNPDTTVYGDPVPAGTWRVLVATWDGSEISGDAVGDDLNLKLYLDGVAEAHAVQGPEFVDVNRTASSISLGGSREVNRFFSGDIAELRLYSGALDEAAVHRLIRGLQARHLGESPILEIDSPPGGRAVVRAGSRLLVTGTASGPEAVLSIVQTQGPGTAIVEMDEDFPVGILVPVEGIYDFEFRLSTNGGTLVRPLRIDALNPSGGSFSSGDIGSATPAGRTEEENGTFTIAGAGADIFGSSDAFHFARRPVTGDFVIQARVVRMDDTDPWAKAGVMIRDGASPQAANAMMALTARNGITMQRRPVSGQQSHAEWLQGMTAPVWVKLERRGDRIQGFRSIDGAMWVPHFESVFVNLPETVEAGLAVTSHLNGTLCEAVFDQVSIDPLIADGPWESASQWRVRNIGDSAAAGGPAPASASGILTGSGAGFEEVSDSLRFAYKSLVGDGEMILRVTGIQGGGGVYGGLMFRSGLERQSSHASLSFSGNGELRFAGRHKEAAYTLGENVNATVPHWIRLRRSGPVFHGFISSDGVMWEEIFPSLAVVDAPPVMEVGIFVSSGDNLAEGAVVFENFELLENPVLLPAPALSLEGIRNPSVANDFRPFAYNYNHAGWHFEKISGPGDLIFDGQGSSSRLAVTRAGLYTLRASATVLGVTVYDEKTLDMSLDARWDFEETAVQEAWAPGGDSGPFSYDNGVLRSVAQAGDPQVVLAGETWVSGELARHLLVRIRSTSAGTAELFWGHAGERGFSPGRIVAADYATPGVWQTLILDPSAHPEWNGRVITDLRFDPPGGAGTEFEIAWIGLSDGDFDGDGVPDHLDSDPGTPGVGWIGFDFNRPDSIEDNGWRVISTDAGGRQFFALVPPSDSSPNTAAHSGSRFVGLHIPFFGGEPFYTQDSPHDTLWLRSPAFRLSGEGNLTVWLAGGGADSPSLDGISADDLPLTAVSNGFRGVALRDVASGHFVLSRSKTSNGGDWEEVSFAAAELAALPADHLYTLELIDAAHGGWGWVNMDSVMIPGHLAEEPEAGIPQLSVRRHGNDQVRISWPSGLSQWMLESSDDLRIFVPVYLPVFPEGSEDAVYDDLEENAKRFYRLSRSAQ